MKTASINGPMGNELGTKRPFVDFYRSLDISPVKQDISDLDRHYQRRESLYRYLGISPLAVRGARVIEFGPGSGFNALYTASLQPSSYTLVDGNPRGIADMRRLFAQYQLQEGIKIVESLIEDFDVTPDYDLVLAEGLIAFQRDPAAFAWGIAQFAKPGAIIVLTCSDAVSVMGDVGRRLIALRTAPAELAFEQRMDILRDLFAPHLSTLPGMSRSVDDWILDNIIQPLDGSNLFSISEAISCLAPSFDVYGSSPRFFTDWRWYKGVTGSARDFNARAKRDYEESLVNLLDYRFTRDRYPAELGRGLLQECEACFELTKQWELGGNVLQEVIARLQRVAALIAPIQSETAKSIESLRRFLSAEHPETNLLDDFGPFFGRGMQYLSFIRRIDE